MEHLVEVFRAFERGELRQIGLSAEQVRRFCPASSGPGWTIESAKERVSEAKGEVVTWPSGRDHIHWHCPLCGRLHISDSVPHADSNPALWFCESGEGVCMVRWERA